MESYNNSTLQNYQRKKKLLLSQTFPKRPCEIITLGLHDEKRTRTVYIFPNIEKLHFSLQNSAELVEFKRQTRLLLEFQKKIIPNNKLQFARSVLQAFGRDVFSSPHNLQDKAWQRQKCGFLRVFYRKRRPHASSVSERVTPKSHTGVSPNFGYLWASRTE